MQGHGYVMMSANNNRSYFMDCPILQKRKLRLREVQSLAQDPSVCLGFQPRQSGPRKDQGAEGSGVGPA